MGSHRIDRQDDDDVDELEDQDEDNDEDNVFAAPTAAQVESMP